VLDLIARRRIVATALRLRGIPYDHSHGDHSWKKLSVRPSSLDCSAFVARVSCKALGYDVGTLAADAKWLMKNLANVEGDRPELGDIVGYCRNATPAEQQLVAGPLMRHVMIYVGNGVVVGACDIAGGVVSRPIAYEPRLGARCWIRVSTRHSPLAPYRRLELRTT